MKSPKMSSKISDIEELNSGPKPAPGRAAAILERRMAEAVIGRALLRILERVISLDDFLELVLGIAIAGIAVRMELHRKLAIGALERRLVGALRHAEHFVEIAFGQSGSVPIAPRPRRGRENQRLR